MKPSTVRLTLGTIIPLFLSCSIMSTLFLNDASSISDLLFWVFAVFFVGSIVMVLPAFVASNIAESWQFKIQSSTQFVLRGGLVGAVCGLTIVLLDFSTLLLLVFTILGFFVGLITALVLRWHYNKFTEKSLHTKL